VKKIAVMKMIGELNKGCYECVSMAEMIESVGELEESMDEKVSDNATLVLKKLYGRRKGDEKERVSVTVSGLIREKEKEKKEKERERKEKEVERKEKEHALKENESLKTELDEIRENERLKKENEDLKKKQSLTELPRSSFNFVVSFCW
jgi:neutral trehalase